MDELAGDSAADHVVTRRRAGDLGGGEGNDGAKAFAPGDDEVRGDLGEVRVGCLHCGVDLTIDPFEILVHRCQGQERRHLGCDGHGRHVIRDAIGPTSATLECHTWPCPHHRPDGVASCCRCWRSLQRSRSVAAMPALPRHRRFLTATSSWSTTLDCSPSTVPDTWTDVDTAPGTADDGTLRPWISASPDLRPVPRSPSTFPVLPTRHGRSRPTFRRSSTSSGCRRARARIWKSRRTTTTSSPDSLRSGRRAAKPERHRG